MENYTPKLHENGRYVEILLETNECPCCKKRMLKELPYDSNFPHYHKINQKSQMESIGLVSKSNVMVDNTYICVECRDAGKVNFLCELCGERKASNKEKISIGYPPVFLCSDCYETVSAKVWDNKIEELNNEHQYDFE